MLFVETGLIYIGYEINKQRKFCVKNQDSCVIGAFGVTFDQRSAFIYMSVTESCGYFVRKFNWKNILEDSPDIAKKLKQNILTDYIMRIRSKVIIAKRRDREKLEQRRDYTNILCINDEDVENQRNLLNNNMQDGDQEEMDSDEYMQCQFGESFKKIVDTRTKMKDLYIRYDDDQVKINSLVKEVNALKNQIEQEKRKKREDF